MIENYGIVITTINYPTRAVVEIARDCSKLNAEFVLIGDKKSPTDFHQGGATYLDIVAQRKSGFRYAEIAPDRHYARKNIGYLHCMREGTTVLIETDDDNIPLPAFWDERNRIVKARSIEKTSDSAATWVNVYSCFTDKMIWPRGLPLEYISNSSSVFMNLPLREVYCPIQQGLADENPDVDAIYRLTSALPFNFEPRDGVALCGDWCPFNSQNTTWWPEAFPLLYLPFYCSFRMTDIWRSFVAQRIAYLNGWNILFHRATVTQERNEHNLLKDFEDEIPGYLNNEKIRQLLEDVI